MGILAKILAPTAAPALADKPSQPAATSQSPSTSQSSPSTPSATLATTLSPPPPAQPEAPRTEPQTPFARNLRQFGLFTTGCALLTASILVSRRSVVRRITAARPLFYSGNKTPVPVDGADRAGLAASALGLATLNVVSFGVLLVGGVSWGFDLCSVRELRERSRQALKKPGLVPEEDEEAMKEMMDMLLVRLGMTVPEGEEGNGEKEGEGQKDEQGQESKS